MNNKIPNRHGLFRGMVGVMLSIGMIIPGLLGNPHVVNAQTCPTLSEGDLYKTPTESTVFFVGEDRQFSYLPNAETYFTWWRDFSPVQVVPTDCNVSLQQATPPGINFRPGSRLVKITTNPRVYAIEPGNIRRWIANPEVAAALYGENWAQLVRDVHVHHWPNLTEGPAITTAIPHTGQLARRGNESQVYVARGGSWHRVTGNLPSFVSADVRRLDTDAFDRLPVSEDSVTAASILDNPANGGIADGDPEPPDDGDVVQDPAVLARLSQDNPAESLVPAQATHVPFLAVDLIAGEDATVERMQFRRIGLGGRENFESLWLSVDEVPITRAQNIGAGDVLEFDTDITLAAGEQITVTLRASLSNANTSQRDGFVLEAIDLAEGEAVLAGNLRGELMSYASATAGQVRIERSGTANEILVGSQEVIGEFSLANESADEHTASFESIRFEVDGVSVADLENLGLYHNGELISEDALVNGDTVTFRIQPGARNIEEGDTREYEVRADIAGGRDAEELVLTLDDDSDLFVRNLSTGYGMAIENALQEGELHTYTIDAGSVSVSRDRDTPGNAQYISDQEDIVALVAQVDVGQPVQVDGLRVWLDAGSEIADSGEEDRTQINADIERVRLLHNDTVIGTLQDIEASNTADNDNTIEANEYFYQFDRTLTLNDDDRLTMEVDLSSDAVPGNQYRFTFAATDLSDPEYIATNRDVGQDRLLGTATGNIIGITSGDVTVARNDGFADGHTIVAGSQDALLMRFVVSAGSETPLEVQRFQVETNMEEEYLNENAARITNCSIRAEGEDAPLGGSTDDLDAQGMLTFTGLRHTIPAGGQQSFGLYCAVNSGITPTSGLVFTIDAEASQIEAQNGNVLTDWVDISSAELRIAEAGMLVVTVESRTPEQELIAAGDVGTEQSAVIGRWQFDAEDDAIDLRTLYFANNPTLGGNTPETDADPLIAGVDLVVNGTVRQTRTPVDGKVRFDLQGAAGIRVPEGETVTVELRARFNPVRSVALSGKQIAYALYALSAVSTGSGEELDADNIENITNTTDVIGGLDAAERAGTIQVYRSVPRVETVALGEQNLLNAEQDIYRFRIAADEAGAIAWSSVLLDITGDCGNQAMIDCLSNITLYEVSDTGSRQELDVTVSTTNESAVQGEVRLSLPDNALQLISAGSSRTYLVEATLQGAAEGDVLAVRIRDHLNTFAEGQTLAEAQEDAGFTAPLVWTDNSGGTRATDRAHWYLGANLPGLDTERTTLIRR